MTDRKVLTTLLLGAAAIAALWTGVFVAIVWAAVGGCEDALLPFSSRACKTGAGAEALMLAALIAALGGTVAVIVWMVRRIRRAERP